MRTIIATFLSLTIPLTISNYAPKMALNSEPETSESVVRESIGLVRLPAVSPEFRNEWTPELEAEFQKRAQAIINYHANKKRYGNAYGENEKRSYPNAMFDFLAGNRSKAIEFLQAEDPQADQHQHTDGIDFYYSFTLKGQIRKYFLFGDFLDPEYKQRMYEGAKKWTAKDPLTNPHPIYGYGDGSGKDWDISRRGLWVDGRNTDNLRAMREIAVYLMAEETGNEETRLLYKAKIRRYVWALYHIGQGEWDSEVYHGHTFAPYLSLYDFAKDPEVKYLAKAALDRLAAAAAVKYYRGGWGGPVKRDYGGANVVYGSGAARTFALYFGDNIDPIPKPELDTLHMITSTYRPPLAVVALARKNFDKPMEILSSKPLYENWKEGKDRQPGYWETTFIGNSYQMGSLVSTFPDGDVAPFKLVADNSQRGVDFFVANTGRQWVRQGKNPGDQIGQYENLLIWLRSTDNNLPFFFQFPVTATSEVEDDIWFVKLEKTWLAIYPINLSDRTSVTISRERLAQRYANEQTFKATVTGSNYGGFALEVGELSTHGDYENFKQKVKNKSQLDLSNLANGKIKLKGSLEKTLELTYNQNNLLPMLMRNGQEHKWSENFDLYNSLSSEEVSISLGWKEGTLKVKAGGYDFQTTVTADGKVFLNPQ